MKVLVTGGAGFIGSRLGRRLQADGHAVRVLDSLSPQIHGPDPQVPDWLRDGSVSFVRGSVTARGDWEVALDEVEAVVHLAAETGTGQSMYEVARYNEVNSQGTALLFDILAHDAKRTVRRVVLASSRSIYGEGRYGCPACGLEPVYPPARDHAQLKAHKWDPSCPRCGATLVAQPTREDDAATPASIYAATKYAQEELVRIACEAMGIGYAILRLQNVYGAGQSLNNPYTGILSIFSTRVRRGLELPLFEDGEETRDFVHVEDVIEAMAAALTTLTAPNAIFNVGSGVATSVAEVAAALSSALGQESRLSVTGQYRIGDIRHNFANIAKLEERLGIVPNVSLEEGLAEFAKWVLSEPLPEDRLEQANGELVARGLMGH